MLRDRERERSSADRLRVVRVLERCLEAGLLREEDIDIILAHLGGCSRGVSTEEGNENDALDGRKCNENECSDEGIHVSVVPPAVQCAKLTRE